MSDLASVIWMPSRQLQGDVRHGDRWARSAEERSLRLRSCVNFPYSSIKNFEMFTDCFGLFSELCHFLGDEIVFSEPTAVEMPHA
ncbi:hypothetical protein RLEG12_24755 [Rhizobium leguminosarum bv. trifolii CB782]|uniref:Uncharacterized protein n=1 Tax=Rhizobium hidalgonense TaxID=1538159 RepID=A0A2A6KCA3_9HYPH|nr:hypothetical protein [Rhizobium hidalgonense]AHG47954.1 hypothetical protein RLEG12_24755 [Rhizobium leguminosarum bv. trifolii CB782]MDR9772363.1 hypothetical protein [Rhizobium hidalgonense]MDR9811450.1 hypothetical protein [Rhizobium hidalgonense]MDR9821486.1 hypothetical protein [Rhizobium hidalgonense]PDT22039.1 hypothetical protein CO674_19445 [Rhizobium hidalgonense]